MRVQQSRSFSLIPDNLYLESSQNREYRPEIKNKIGVKDIRVAAGHCYIDLAADRRTECAGCGDHLCCDLHLDCNLGNG